MSRIHYFQRYSTKENSVTNNTLLLFGRLYNSSVVKFEEFLSKILGYQIEVGPDFSQQVRGASSVPDAMISQSSFKIIIETKVDSWIRHDQIVNHCSGFCDEKRKILLYIGKTRLADSEVSKIKQLIKEKDAGINFAFTDFETIGSSFREVISPTDFDLQEMAEDWESYCKDAGLLDVSKYFMKVVPCGTSFEINLKYDIYFHPSGRSYSDHNYIGIYKNKSVQAIGEIETIVDVNLDDGSSKFEIVRGKMNEDIEKRIHDIIRDATTNCGYDIRNDHRFFCVKNFIQTEFIKETPYGIMGARYFDLSKLVNSIEILSLDEVAEKLKSKRWE